MKDEGSFSELGQNPPSRFYLVAILVVGGRREGRMEGRRVEELSQMAKSGSDISSFGVSKKEREGKA